MRELGHPQSLYPDQPGLHQLMLWPTARTYIRGAGLGHAGLDLVRPIPLAGI